MSIDESIIEKYLREMTEMHKRAKTEEQLPDWSDSDLEETEEPIPDFTIETEENMGNDADAEEEPPCEPEEKEDTVQQLCSEDEEKEQTDESVSVCPICGGKIAMCEFYVEDAENGGPIEYAQIMLYRDDGYFIRTLTDKEGKTCEIPVFADDEWRVSITAQGYISVSKAPVSPVEGEKLTVPVRLDESLSLDGVFAERSEDRFVGAQQNNSSAVI